MPSLPWRHGTNVTSRRVWQVGIDADSSPAKHRGEHGASGCYPCTPKERLRLEAHPCNPSKVPFLFAFTAVKTIVQYILQVLRGPAPPMLYVVDGTTSQYCSRIVVLCRVILDINCFLGGLNRSICVEYTEYMVGIGVNVPRAILVPTRFYRRLRCCGHRNFHR